jgi:hypothetical protein
MRSDWTGSECGTVPLPAGPKVPANYGYSGVDGACGHAAGPDAPRFAGPSVRQSVRVKFVLAVAGFALLSGCTTPTNPNPPSAAANTGYVDLYCASASDLSWDVLRFDPKSGKMKPAYSKYAPFPGNVLRISSPVGSQRFQIGIFNKANRGPVQVAVEVENGKVTPVNIMLEHLGQTTVDRKLYGFRGSSKGYLRGTKIITEQNTLVQIHAEAQAVRPYEPKEQMAYVERAPGTNTLTPTGR